MYRFNLPNQVGCPVFLMSKKDIESLKQTPYQMAYSDNRSFFVKKIGRFPNQKLWVKDKNRGNSKCLDWL